MVAVTGERSFVGRTSELEVLSALAARAVAGSPAAAIVVGDPGLGKTRLLGEVVRRLDVPAVAAYGYEAGREVALGAGSGVLRELARVPGAGERLETLLLGGAGAGGELESVRVFEAAFRCLVERGPLVVVADDIQWIDRETRALLHYLLAAARAEGGVPLLVLCAGRPGAEAGAFGDALRSCLTSESAVELVLGPLGREEGVDLAAQLSSRLEREDAEALWAKAQGSPFWLEALARADSGAATPEGLIAGRTSGLDLDSGRLLALLLVVGQPLDVAEGARLLDWEEGRVRRAALVLANRALTVQEAGTVRVAHDLIREAAAEALPDAERRRLHGRLAVWLEECAGENVQELRRALEHRRAAGLPAVALAARLARSPRRRLLGPDGLRLLVRIAEDDPGDGGVGLRRGAAALAEELGEWALALELRAVLTERLPGPGERAEAAVAAAQAAFMLDRPSEVRAFVARARALAPDDPVVGIEVDAHEAQVLRWLENRPIEAVELTDRAAAAAARLAETAGGVEALGERERRAGVAALRGRLGAAIRAGDAAAVAASADEIARWSRDPAEALVAACDAVFALMMFEGVPLLAEARARRVVEEARRLVLPGIEAEATAFLADALVQLGQLEDAERLVVRAVALTERLGGIPGRTSLAGVRAGVHAVAASRADWRPALAGIVEQIEAEDNPHYRLVTRIEHARLLSRFSTPTRVELHEWLTAMHDDAQAAGCERCRWASVLAASEVQARHGDLQAAKSLLADWDGRYPEPRPGPAAQRAYVEALLVARSDSAAALPLFERAAELAKRATQRLLGLWIELDAGVARASVDPPAAIEVLRGVAAQAESIGAASEQQLAVQRLRALGVRTWRRGPSRSGGTLTEREWKIAELVAAGASNPEIAKDLFLSRKTVERHVSNILAKLGARNRAELAALLTRKGGGTPR